MHAPHVQRDLRLLVTGLDRDFLDERRGQGFEWPYLIRQAQVHSPPVTKRRQRGDAFELRMERALNDVQGRQDGRVSLELERQQIEGAGCAWTPSAGDLK